MWITNRNGKVMYRMKYVDPVTEKEKFVSVTYPKDTKRNRAEAEEILNNLIEEKLSDQKISGATLQKIYDDYIAEQSNSVKPSTLKRNKNVLNCVLNILGKDVIADKLTAGYVRKLLMESKKDNITLNNYLKRFFAMMRWAYRYDYVQSIAWIDKMERFKEDGTRKEKLQNKFLESEELSILLDACRLLPDPRWYHVTRILALSGMRIGELIALDVSDVDFQNHCIHVNKNYDHINRILNLSTKTDSSTRDVFIQNELHEALKDCIREMKIYQMLVGFRSDRLIPDDKGYMQYNSYRDNLLKASQNVLGRKVTPHVLRHTHTALLAENDIKLDSISRRLGHSDSKVTKDVYFHVTKKLEEHDRQDLNKVLMLAGSVAR